MDSQALSKYELLQRLSGYSKSPLQIQLHENTQTLISFNFSSSSLTTIRMHKGFLKAPEYLIQAMGAYLQKRDREAWSLINEFAQTGLQHNKPNLKRNHLQQGEYHKLKELFDEVNMHYFNSEISLSISWGAKPKKVKRGLIKKQRRSICFGHYNDIRQHIILNRKLDHPHVESEFIKYIIFHEILHHTIPSQRVNGRWIHHSPEFKRAEKKYPNFNHMQKRSAELLRSLN